MPSSRPADQSSGYKDKRTNKDRILIPDKESIAMKPCLLKIIIIPCATVGLLLLTLSTIFGATQSGANSPGALFTAANAAYAKRHYQRAIALYQKIDTQGYQSGPLLFNLGNAYYKTGATGRAVLYYEKARRLMPRDADLQANLAYALKNVNEGALPWQNRLWEQVVSCLTPEQSWTYASLTLFCLAGLVILVILKPQKLSDWKPWPQAALALTSFGFAILLTLAVSVEIDRSHIYAVAVKEGGAARFEPDAKATLHFVLPEGARIRILERRGGWSLAQRRDGARGWVANPYLKQI
jgi:tetratricopeptide (TPR) repeat protein